MPRRLRDKDVRQPSGSGRGRSGSDASATHRRPRFLAHPLEMLYFLLPLIVFYEVACWLHPQRVVAYAILRQFFALFGPVGVWAPGLAIVVILLATHAASGRRAGIAGPNRTSPAGTAGIRGALPGGVRWSRVGWMYVESGLLCLPLLVLNGLVAAFGVDRLVIGGGWERALRSLFVEIAQGVGAGVYEELVFRLMLISVIVLIGADLLRFHGRSVAVVAVGLSAVLFAAHHHAPMGPEPFNLLHFVFRTVAGVYLSLVFWYRGYALAAGCHAAYNTALIGTGFIGPA